MRRTRSHRIRAGAALGVLALVLTACGSDDSSSPTGTPERERRASPRRRPEVTRPSSSGPTTRPTQRKAVEPLCKAWAEANGVTCMVKMFNGGASWRRRSIRGNDTGDVPGHLRGPARPDRQARRQRHPGSRRHLRERRQVLRSRPWPRCSTRATPTASRGRSRTSRCSTNKKLSPECPATLDEAVANAKKLISEGKVTDGLGIAMQIGETGDFYHWYPLFTADGGYAFAPQRRRLLQPRRPGYRPPMVRIAPPSGCSSWPTRASSRHR